MRSDSNDRVGEYESSYGKSPNYPFFCTLLDVEKDAFFAYFKRELPSFKEIRDGKTARQRIFKQYFEVRNGREIVEKYPYQHLYVFQGKLLSSSEYEHYRKIFFRDIISFLIKHSNLASLFSDGNVVGTSDFFLRLNMAKVEDISLAVSDEWDVARERILAFIVIKFFKEHPETLLAFVKGHFALDKEQILSYLQARTEQKKSKQVRTNMTRELGDVLKEEENEQEEGNGQDFFRIMLRPEEKDVMDFDEDGNIIVPNMPVHPREFVSKDLEDDELEKDI